ncbi:AI-2E family transporter [Pseudonocardia sp. RS11V-5]|uniref:AI-2E family transporter n=1 Tax=Pseudonocardia terrae TaxID=2905831 RepID=UPI001E348D50|nr:AI-2E family transporter [Pseudonocardia terrae]MCE3556006.1 AI-2E family transporter [Pseudonocardia terrae]
MTDRGASGRPARGARGRPDQEGRAIPANGTGLGGAAVGGDPDAVRNGTAGRTERVPDGAVDGVVDGTAESSLAPPSAAPARAVPPPDRGAVIGGGLTWLATWSWRILLIAFGAILLGLVVGALWPIVFPVLLGVILATVLRPPVGWLVAHRFPPALAALLVLVAALVVLGGIITLIAPQVAGQSDQIAAGVTGGLGQIQQWVSGPPLNLGEGQIGGVLESITRQLQASASTIAGTVLTGVSAFANGLLNIVLAVVLAFFFVKDGPRFLPWVTRVTGARAGRHVAGVLQRAWRTLGGFIRTQALVAFVDAFFIGLGLVLLGVPLALPLAVLTFFGSFVPIVGALVAGALSVLVALVTKGFTTALIVLAIIIAVQQIEGNVLQPILQSRSLNLHGAVVLLAVTAGGAIWGIAGAFLAVPVAAVAAEVLRYIGEEIDRRAGARGAPPSDAPEGPDGDVPEGPDADVPESGTAGTPADRTERIPADDGGPGPVRRPAPEA